MRRRVRLRRLRDRLYLWVALMWLDWDLWSLFSLNFWGWVPVLDIFAVLTGN